LRNHSHGSCCGNDFNYNLAVIIRTFFVAKA
jgi:hypothetical protein